MNASDEQLQAKLRGQLVEKDMQLAELRLEFLHLQKVNAALTIELGDNPALVLQHGNKIDTPATDRRKEICETEKENVEYLRTVIAETGVSLLRQHFSSVNQKQIARTLFVYRFLMRDKFCLLRWSYRIASAVQEQR